MIRILKYINNLKIKVMKIRILESSGWYKNYVSYGFEVNELDTYSNGGLRFSIRDKGWVYAKDCVITELPESFCVKRCDDTEKWKKYIKWLNRIYDKHLTGDVSRYYGVNIKGEYDNNHSFATELHIDDIIKHIDFYSEPMPIDNKEEFDMTTNEGRLDYAKKHYPVGTKYKSTVSGQELIVGSYDGHLHPQLETGWTVYHNGVWAEIVEVPKDEFDMDNNEGRLAYAKKYFTIGTNYIPRHADGSSWERECEIIFTPVLCIITGQIEGGRGYIYSNGKWAEIIKKEEKMETQKLSRQGLKEIHSIACTSWKNALENWGTRNPLEDYIELTNEEISKMFRDCTLSQSTIVSKYLKQDDGSVDLSRVTYDEDGTRLNGTYIVRHNAITSITNGFWLNPDYNWEVKMISDTPFLVPTKKK